MAGLFFAAMTDAVIREPILRALEHTGVRKSLGKAMFGVECFHQSLSHKYGDSPELIERLLDAGRSVTAAPFVLALDHFSGPKGYGKIYWALRSKKKPDGFVAIQKSIKSGLRANGLEVSREGHTAHITISYRAPDELMPIPIPPIYWTINEFALVRGGGKPYRYEILGRWPLLEKPKNPGGQLDLLEP